MTKRWDANKDGQVPKAGKITTKDGLLYRDGKVINLPEADWVALQHGHLYAERFVKALAAEQPEKKPED